MTPWRTPPILQDEKPRDKDREDRHGAETEIATETAAPAEQRSLGDRIKTLFRETMRCLMRRDLAPEPKPAGRRKTEDTGGGFKLAASRILTRFVWTPVVTLYEPELWQWNNPGGMHQAVEDFHYAEQNHLSPQP